MEPVVRYFYFLEIKEIKCQDVFELFEVASFLKVQELIKQIKNFLQKPLESKERALILFKKSFEFILSFPINQEKEFFDTIIQNCGLYLLENSFYDYFLDIFDQNFLMKIGDFISNSFDFIMKKIINLTL